jgi:predicted TIM-barrel fold metal-dependent hydrolase
VRFNLVSPMGNAAANIDAVIARIRPLGWHVQFFLQPAQYRWVCERQLDWGVPVVLDHLAGMRFDHRGQADIETLFVIGDHGAWIKASGYYRLGMKAPFDDVDAMIERLQKRFAGRMVWGSDWPHTWYMEQNRGGAPPYDALLAPLLRVFPDDAILRSILCDAPTQLYQ